METIHVGRLPAHVGGPPLVFADAAQWDGGVPSTSSGRYRYSRQDPDFFPVRWKQTFFCRLHDAAAWRMGAVSMPIFGALVQPGAVHRVDLQRLVDVQHRALRSAAVALVGGNARCSAAVASVGCACAMLWCTQGQVGR
jgi:hypothetical protein